MELPALAMSRQMKLTLVCFHQLLAMSSQTNHSFFHALTTKEHDGIASAQEQTANTANSKFGRMITTQDLNVQDSLQNRTALGAKHEGEHQQIAQIKTQDLFHIQQELSCAMNANLEDTNAQENQFMIIATRKHSAGSQAQRPAHIGFIQTEDVIQARQMELIATTH